MLNVDEGVHSKNTTQILLLLLLPVHFAKVGSLNNLHRIVVNKDNNSLTPTPIKRRRRQHKDAGCCLKIKSIERIDKKKTLEPKHTII